MKHKIVFLSLFICLVGAGLVIFNTPELAQASNSIVDTNDGAYQDGGYTLTHVRNYLIYLMYFILGLVGTLSLAAFVYGGLVFLTSAGSDQKVKKGKDIVGAAVIGLVIVFSSVLIIQTLFGGLGVEWDSTSGNLMKIQENSGAGTGGGGGTVGGW